MHATGEVIHITVDMNGTPQSFGVQDICGHKALALAVRHKPDDGLCLNWGFTEADPEVRIWA